MKMFAIAAVGVLGLSGCASYYGPGPEPINGAPSYDAFYDGGYGDFYDGYWGGGGVFYYSRGPRGRYFADRGGHFRHDAGPTGNWSGVHGHGPGPGARFHGGGGPRGGHGPR